MLFFVFKLRTAYDVRISDGSSDVCSSDLRAGGAGAGGCGAEWRTGDAGARNADLAAGGRGVEGRRVKPSLTIVGHGRASILGCTGYRDGRSDRKSVG